MVSRTRGKAFLKLIFSHETWQPDATLKKKKNNNRQNLDTIYFMYNTDAKAPELWIHTTWSASQLSHLLALQPWARHFVSSSLSFPMCKVRMMVSQLYGF